MRSFVAALALMLAAILPAAAQENTLVMETPHGEVVIELRPDLRRRSTPSACAPSPPRASTDGGCRFQPRVIEGFMAQTGGSVRGTGTGGSDLGRTFPAEFTNTPFRRGSIGMARTAETRTRPQHASFFIVYDRGRMARQPVQPMSADVRLRDGGDRPPRQGARASRAWCPTLDRIVGMRVGPVTPARDVHEPFQREATGGLDGRSRVTSIVMETTKGKS